MPEIHKRTGMFHTAVYVTTVKVDWNPADSVKPFLGSDEYQRR